MLGKEFAALLKPLGINGRRGFYSIRHTFQTIAERSRDLPAVMHVMGHADSTVSALYRERVDDDRLEHVADVVRAWLFNNQTDAEGGAR
jgi:integrase